MLHLLRLLYSLLSLLNTPVVPVTCDIICAGGDVVLPWVLYFLFVFVFKQPLAALYHAFIYM